MGLYSSARFCGNCKKMARADPTYGQHILFCFLLLLLILPGLLYKFVWMQGKICYHCGLNMSAFEGSGDKVNLKRQSFQLSANGTNIGINQYLCSRAKLVRNLAMSTLFTLIMALIALIFFMTIDAPSRGNTFVFKIGMFPVYISFIIMIAFVVLWYILLMVNAIVMLSTKWGNGKMDLLKKIWGILTLISGIFVFTLPIAMIGSIVFGFQVCKATKSSVDTNF